MGLIKKLFEKYKRIGEESSSKVGNAGQTSEFMPKPNMPIEDKFLINFKENGGKFLYCTDFDEALSYFNGILKENDWTHAFCKEKRLQGLFSKSKISFFTHGDNDFALTACEFLVADTGAILLSSNQIGEKRLYDLPENLVVFASVGQLIPTLSDGLQNINLRRQKIPSNITTIKNFYTQQKQSSHFMNYGSVAKNTYLLLLEDF